MIKNLIIIIEDQSANRSYYEQDIKPIADKHNMKIKAVENLRLLTEEDFKEAIFFLVDAQFSLQTRFEEDTHYLPGSLDKAFLRQERYNGILFVEALRSGAMDEIDTTIRNVPIMLSTDAHLSPRRDCVLAAKTLREEDLKYMDDAIILCGEVGIQEFIQADLSQPPLPYGAEFFPKPLGDFFKKIDRKEAARTGAHIVDDQENVKALYKKNNGIEHDSRLSRDGSLSEIYIRAREKERNTPGRGD